MGRVLPDGRAQRPHRGGGAGRLGTPHGPAAGFRGALHRGMALRYCGTLVGLGLGGLTGLAGFEFAEIDKLVAGRFEWMLSLKS